MNITLALHVEKHPAEDEPKAVDKISRDGLSQGWCSIEPADNAPSQATADRAYRSREAVSLDHPAERWQDQGKRLCFYEDDISDPDEKQNDEDWQKQ